MSGVSTSVKVQRLLAIVPWVVERGGATIAQIADQFEMSESAVYDLLLAAMCYEVVGAGMQDNLGIVVFGGDELDDLDETTGGGRGDGTTGVGARRRARPAHGEAWVHVEPGAMLDRPLNLSVPQAFGILVAGQSAMSLRGADRTGALATALEKLSATYGERVRVSVDLAVPQSLGVLRAARDAGTTVRIHYYAPITDEVSDRLVDPLAIVLHNGHWYLRGWCHLRADLRSFRADRIEKCHDTGELHGRAVAEVDAAPIAPAEADGATEVILSIPRHDLWRVEAYPSLSVSTPPSDGSHRDGDRRLVTYAIRSPRILQQMLLRLGADAYVVNRSELSPELADAGESAAVSILDLYGEAAS